jgi:hypothetical protein
MQLDDLSLSDDEIDLLQTWSDDGAPEGIDSGESFPKFISGTSLESVDQSITIGSAWNTHVADGQESVYGPASRCGSR